MDLVYALGTGSRWKNNEIRYSLRSVHRHVKDIDHVFVVGELPSFLKNIHHIPCPDGLVKERNIMSKILKACDEECLSEKFLFINDDHFFLQPTKTDGMPYYSKGTLEEALNRRKYFDTYKQSLQNTFNELYRKGLPSYHFDIHCPIVYDKKLFPEVMDCFDWNVPAGYVIKSLYANTLSKTPQMMVDSKIDKLLTKEKIHDRIKDRWIFSMGDKSIGGAMASVMEELYPDKSRWEK